MARLRARWEWPEPSMPTMIPGMSSPLSCRSRRVSAADLRLTGHPGNRAVGRLIWARDTCQTMGQGLGFPADRGGECRLAEWVPTMRRAEPAGDAEVHLEGESHGHPYSLDSMLRADPGDRRLDWGAGADDGYRGWLQVVDQPPGSAVHLHVAVPDDRLGPSADAAVAEIRQGMEEAFDRLAGLIGS